MREGMLPCIKAHYLAYYIGNDYREDAKREIIEMVINREKLSRL